MSTKLLSRILLSTLCVGMCALGIFFAMGGYAVYALILLGIGGGALLWIWKPWRLLKTGT